MSYSYRKCEPNIRIEVPGWSDPCLDVLALPDRILTDGEGHYRLPKDGRLGQAATTLRKAYHRHCEEIELTITYGGGLKKKEKSLRLSEEVLVGRIFGPEFDGVMRAAFAKCIEILGAQPEEIITLGERVYQDHKAAEAAKKVAWDTARTRVDAACDEFFSPYMEGKIKEAFFRLLTEITLRTGRVPLVALSGREPYLGFTDLERSMKRRLPRGHQVEGLRKMFGKRFISLHGLCLFGFGLLREWYFEDEDNELVSTIYHMVIHLQYQILNSTQEGRQVLDGMLGTLGIV